MSKPAKKLLLFAALGIPASCALYAVIIGSGVGINGGSVFALALMWVPGLAALLSKLAVDHSVKGMGWRLSLHGLRCMGTAYVTFLADFLCVRAHSFWPAVLLHASHNVFVQSVFDTATINGPYTQYFTSEFGIGLAAGYAIVCLILYKTTKKV